MSRIEYTIKRILYVLPTFLGVTLLIFGLFNVIADDPARILLGQHASPEAIAQLQHRLGLDRSLWMQYVGVLKSAFTFQFGRSWVTHQDIGELLRNGGKISCLLMIPPFLLAHGTATIGALFTAQQRGRLADRGVVMLTIMLMSLPMLAYILFAQWFFAYRLGWFPISGYSRHAPFPYLVLPGVIVFVLTLGSALRFYRTLVLQELGKDYVLTAYAKGLSVPQVLFKHVLKNALVPITTNVLLEIPNLLLGALLLESFFGIPGIGSSMVRAMGNADFPVIKALAILSASLYTAFNLLSDLINAWIDPRIQLN